jgi:predicted AlkP superfamily phosphohydrolase/phosphomutase
VALPSQKPLKVLVVGLDGAAWSVIEPLARAGQIPNIARIMAGVRGPLESTIPPVTPPAWTSFMTGMNPGKHGLYHFVEPEPGTYRTRYTNAGSRKARTIWSILSEAGHRVGVVNVPMTYPPEPVDGFMISGMDTPDEASEFIHPRSLVQELRQAVGPIKLDVRFLGFMHNDPRRQQVLGELHDIDEQRFQMMLHLLDREPVEVCMVVYGSTDTAQHYFWHYADPSHYRYDPHSATVFGNAIGDVYRRLDRQIGVLMERLREDGVVMVVSDHGFGPTSSKTIYLNRYLAELGLLTYLGSGTGGVGGLVSNVVRGMDQRLRGALSSDQKKRLARLFPTLRTKWEASLTAFDAIDWGMTKAYCSEVLASPANIWINVKGRQPQGTVNPGVEYNELVDFLSERLLALKDPHTGRRVVERVLRKNEVYEGPHLDQAPDLLLAWWEGEGFNAKTSLPKDHGKPVVGEEPAEVSGRAEWSGTHRMDGVLAVRGSGIKVGAQVTGARIMDMAPTILHLLGEPIPDDMDGRVLTEMFDSTHLERYPVRYRTAGPAGPATDTESYSDEESEMIRKRLQDLGYLE